MKEMQKNITNILVNKDNFTAFAAQAVEDTQKLFTFEGQKNQSINVFMSRYNQQFDRLCAGYLCDVLEIGPYAMSLIVDGGDDLAISHVDYIVTNNLCDFDKNLHQFFGHLEAQNFIDADQLFPSLLSEFEVLRAYGGFECDFEKYLKDVQIEFTDCELDGTDCFLMENFDKYIEQKSLSETLTLNFANQASVSDIRNKI